MPRSRQSDATNNGNDGANVDNGGTPNQSAITPVEPTDIAQAGSVEIETNSSPSETLSLRKSRAKALHTRSDRQVPVLVTRGGLFWVTYGSPTHENALTDASNVTLAELTQKLGVTVGPSENDQLKEWSENVSSDIDEWLQRGQTSDAKSLARYVIDESDYVVGVIGSVAFIQAYVNRKRSTLRGDTPSTLTQDLEELASKPLPSFRTFEEIFSTAAVS